MVIIKRYILIGSLIISGGVNGQTINTPDHKNEKTAFQIAAPWNEAYDVRSDVAIVYGVNDAGGKFEERVKGWRDKGYKVHFMTGIAWGQYQDYFLGEYDGKTHLDEGQVERDGDTIWHGKNVPYTVPSDNFLKYLKTHLKRAIDAGVSAIHLEEPEFWARAGYSGAFKKEWKRYYGFDWKPQHESPEATYQSSKLKYDLYYNALKECFAYVKSYSKSVGKDVKCYVPTHSLINYSSWRIVSPEASLASIKDVDGYIAQVWTGTSREPVYFNGVEKERVFENAFLEYGSMISMIQPTGKKIFLLTDPIEDWPRTWDDYKKNYQATFTAKLLYPTVADYEVMPWPNRIYLGKFKMEGSDEKQPIAPAYAMQMQVMVNSLNEIPVSNNKLNGSHGMGVLVSNSMMFQRFPTHEGYEDPQLSNFYGMAMPLLKRGVPIETVHMENLLHENALKNIKVLIMSYSNMKPLNEAYHTELADWVKKGGVLIYYGRDNDPFQEVNEWWNTKGKNYKAPSEDLFEKLNIADTSEFIKSGKGWVSINRHDPKELVLTKNADNVLINKVKEAYEVKANATKLAFKNNFLLHRGPYIIAAVLNENDDQTPLVIKGPVVDLFDPELPVLREKTVKPGEQAYLYNINAATGVAPKVLATAARVYNEEVKNQIYTFTVKSPANTVNVMRIKLPQKPIEISMRNGDNEIPIDSNKWDAESKTVLLKFKNLSKGIDVKIRW
ncbi:hypothetical protein [Niabella ginsengisoli]|uniref:Beta-galactosidase trimerisation domain-containing protein n=1 Tax=Niabella ginsengisoli TaxID=522298 RepID=A0ABS9SLB2_9BACT|nr:hypothetical protein [Niabella ginsengisoli]MCH5599173.1 hypothetical protein [Niabella ginsengisoli]